MADGHGKKPEDFKKQMEDNMRAPANEHSHVKKVRDLAAAEGSEVFVICAQIEQEIAELDDDEKAMYEATS